MAQLRQDYAEFQSRNAEILTMGPDGPNAFRRYWENNQVPFIGMADIKSRVADLYYQKVNIFKLGRMPALFIIDLEGNLRFSHYGDSMANILPNSILLDFLDVLNSERHVPDGNANPSI